MKPLKKVHRYIRDKLESGEKLHFSLIDPDKADDLEELEKLADTLTSYGTDAFLIGGSLGVTPVEADNTAKTLKKTGLPVIVFPGNLNCITPYADAILYMVLMNTVNTYYLIEAQIAAAPLIKKYGLETLPTGYVVFYSDTAVAHIGRVYPIPVNKPEVILAYGWAAEMLGMKYMYLEAGSGASQPIPPVYPRLLKEQTSLTVIVGGGIRTPDTAAKLVENGADILVTGTLIEERSELLREIIRAVKTS